MNFIQKIFENNNDEYVHSQFVRFGIGDYYPRAVLTIKSGSTTKMKSGFEYGNDFVKFIIDHVTTDVEVKGKIYSKVDFTSELVETKEKKKGFFIGNINRKLTIKDLSKLHEQFYKEGYLLLNIKGENFDLKINQSPHNPRGSYKEDFCKFSLKGELAEKAVKEFAFDIDKEFKQAMIKHRFMIDDVKIPKEFENDMAIARLMAKRIGKIVRELSFDGEELKKETKLNA